MEVRETVEDIEAALPNYGLMAEFTDPEDLLEATRRTVDAGYRRIDAYSPFPVEGLAEALHIRNTRLPLIILGGGILGQFRLCAVLRHGDRLPVERWRRRCSWPNFIGHLRARHPVRRFCRRWACSH
jgi:hypothetical protein